MPILDSVIDCIGNTPLVRLNHVTAGIEARQVLVKLEMQNPGGSIKDRIALEMIRTAEEQGLITPGKSTIVEYTSGNTGIGLAMAAAALGYGCIIIMPQLPPVKERYLICRKFGAQVHLTAGARGMIGMKEYAEQLLASNPNFWCPRQFENPANVMAHYETTGPEIWEDTEGGVDIVIAGAGTGGTIAGVGRYLKEKKPSVKVICVEPTESRVLVGEKHCAHMILGIGGGIELPLLKELAPDQPWQEGPRGVIDEFLHCSSAQAIEHADLLAKGEGLLVGPSSGAVCKVALDVARRPESKGKTIVAILASSAIRYVTHPVWNAEQHEAAEALPTPPSMEPEPLLRWVSP